jgi:uncharacterized protein (TIGR02391 family)
MVEFRNMPKKYVPPQAPVPKVFRSGEFSPAIAKLNRRIDVIQKFIDENVYEEDQRVSVAEEATRNTILEVFGPDSPEYRRHDYFKIDRTPKTVNMGRSLSRFRGGGFPYGGPQQASQASPQGLEGYRKAIVDLQGMVRSIEEQRVDAGETGAALEGHAGRTRHARVAAASDATFRDGHYREAVLNATTALCQLVRTRSGIEEDGVKLMRRAFGGDAPPLAFNDLKDQSDLDEQEGLGHICAGVALALRNPRAHDLDPDTREDAVDCLAFISYLMRRVETAKRKA